MTYSPKASTQISLYHKSHLVTRGAGVPIEKCSHDEQIAVYLVDQWIETASIASRCANT